MREPETLKYLSMFPLPEIDFKVPLVFSPGGVEKLSREDLMNILEQLEEQHATPAPGGPASFPV